VSAPASAQRRGGVPAVYGVWLSAALVSQGGDAALRFALAWAASGIGGLAAGLVMSAVVFPRTLLMLIGGVVGDRVGARRVMITGDAVMLVIAVVLGAVAYRWGTPLLLLVTAALLVGLVDAFYLPSSGSMPRRLVEDEYVSRAVAWRQSGSQLVAMVGAPAGGAVVAVAGFAAAAWADAATFAVVLAVLVAIRPRYDMPDQAAADGVRVALRTPGLGPALLLVAGAAGFIIPTTVLLVPLLARQSQWSATSAGLIVGAQGIGVIAATLVAARRGSSHRPGVAAAVGLVVTAAGQCVIAVAQQPWPAIAAAVLVGIGNGVFVCNLAPVMLGTAPRSHLARIQALLGLVQSAALLITANVLGAVAHAASASAAILCCAAVLTGCAVVALLTPTLRHLTNAPATDPRS
jgi:MFS family permease